MENKVIKAYFVSNKTYIIINSEEKRIKKSKTVDSKTLSELDYVAMYNNQKVSAERTVSHKDYSKGSVNIIDETVELDPASYTKHEKIYDKDYFWIDTKPLLYKEGVWVDTKSIEIEKSSESLDLKPIFNTVDKGFILIDDITKDFILINEYIVVYNLPLLNMILYNTPFLSLIVVNNTRDFYMIYDFNVLQTRLRSNYLRSASMMYISSSDAIPDKIVSLF